MSHILTSISQKAKFYLLSSSNYRFKIWQFSKPRTEHLPGGISIVELSLTEFVMQFLPLLIFSVILLLNILNLQQMLGRIQKARVMQHCPPQPGIVPLLVQFVRDSSTMLIPPVKCAQFWVWKLPYFESVI